MLRNREFRYLIFAQVALLIISLLLIMIWPSFTIIIVVVSSLLYIGSNLLFSRWRYREIAKLSGYLRQISAGQFSLDVRDNAEGELSILKNDIYKVTLQLSRYSSGLKEEKQELTNAISDISHQLETPLTSMMVMSDLLKSPNLNQDKRIDFTQHIVTQLERMDWLISSLLKLSKVDAGTIQFKKDRVTISQLVEKALEPVLIPIELKEIVVEESGDRALTAEVDWNWTKEAFINLIKNAVEHTPPQGKITIAYHDNPLYTEIQLRDNGRGIAVEDVPHIFKRFYKGKNASESSVGIGLAMAYSIITSQRGDIEVISKLDEGTVFFIKFYKQII